MMGRTWGKGISKDSITLSFFVVFDAPQCLIIHVKMHLHVLLTVAPFSSTRQRTVTFTEKVLIFTLFDLCL